MESLIIKTFGPIIQANISIKDINIYIGTTSSGKSTVAKLVSIFKSGQLNVVNDPMDSFKKMLANYNIDFNISQETYIKYQMDDFFYEIKNKVIETNYSGKSQGNFLN